MIGVADDERGQIVEAHVVLVEGVAADDVTRKLLQDHVKATIAPYKYPRSVKFTDGAAQDADRQDPALPAARASNDRPISPGHARCSTSRTASSISTAIRSAPCRSRRASAVADMLSQEWGEQLIRGWNSAGWMMQPRRIGDRIGRLIGAPEGSVVMGDTLSIKVYQALASALELNPAAA